MAIRNAIIAVDFDGTVVTHAYPEIGEDAGAVPVLRELTGNGCRLILYTMRHGALLTEAVEWFRRHGIPLYAVNENPAQRRWTSSPKSTPTSTSTTATWAARCASPRAKSGPWPTGRASANSSCARVFSTEWRTDEGRKAKFALANSPRIRYICVRKQQPQPSEMKKILIWGLVLLASAVGTGSASAQLRIGGRKINTSKLLSAGKDVAQAVTLSDKDIADLSREAVTWMDENNPVAPDSSEYVQRLKRLTEGITDADGLPLNFKVYLVTDVNAFACGDGSIRVFSSLMDLMDDDQLMAIIGHEIGHVVHADVKHAMKTPTWPRRRATRPVRPKAASWRS